MKTFWITAFALFMAVTVTQASKKEKVSFKNDDAGKKVEVYLIMKICFVLFVIELWINI